MDSAPQTAQPSGAAPRRGLKSWGRVALGVATLLLPACADRVLYTGLGYDYLTGENPVDEGAARPVRGMSGRETEFPTIISVPDRPPPLPSPAQRQQEVDSLTAERRAGALASGLLKEIAPLPVPAKPDLGQH